MVHIDIKIEEAYILSYSLQIFVRNSYTAWLTILVKFDQSSHPQFTPRRETLVRAEGGGAGGVAGDQGGKVAL